MRAKEYLSQVRFLDERITCKLADAARLQDMATRITPILREDGVSGGRRCAGSSGGRGGENR